MCYFKGHIQKLGTVPEHFLTPLEKKLTETPDVWAEEDTEKPNNFGVFENSTQHIVFQFPQNLKTHKHSYYRPIWADWQDLIAPLIEHITPYYDYPRGRTTRIMLARLKAGAKIGHHTDGAPAARVPHKIHVPIITNQAVSFIEDNTTYHLKRGFTYEVNNRIPHSAENNSTIDRVHLIFDYFDNRSFWDRLRGPLRGFSEPKKTMEHLTSP